MTSLGVVRSIKNREKVVRFLPGSNSHDTTTNDSSKIASIRARPVSKRITASEIEELLVRQGTSQSNQNSHSSSNLSSFAPLPVATNSDNRSINSVSSTAANSPATASRVFSSVAQMKRQRAALQQQRRKTDVVSVTSLHKDYHSTPDLSAEGDGCLDGADDDETEELYSDTVFCNGDVYSNTRESAGPYGNNPPQTQVSFLELTLKLLVTQQCVAQAHYFNQVTLALKVRCLP